jgi:hypothetical protein
MEKNRETPFQQKILGVKVNTCHQSCAETIGPLAKHKVLPEKQGKKRLGHGSSGPVSQALGPEFKPQYHPLS